MMAKTIRYAIIVGNKVAELIEAPPDYCVPNLQVAVAPKGVAPGWRYENGEFRPPEENDESEFVH